MKLNRSASAFVATAASALLLTACGSDPGSAPGGAAPGGGATSGGGAAGPPPGVTCGGKSTVTGEGSTAQNNAMAVFIQAYQQACDGYNVAYNPTGSGAGVRQFTAGLVDFGGSDSQLSAAEVGPAAQRCGGNPAWHIPLVFGPLAVAYNLPGVNELVLNGETVGKIFNGGIKTWDDPAIKALNPNAQLPSSPITVIFRSDDSGTTDNFQQYLVAASKGSWTQGAGKKFAGGVGEGRQGNAGVSQGVAQGSAAITYTELSFAKDNKLGIAKIDNGSGPVELTDATAGKAIEGVKFAGEGNDLKLDVKSIFGNSEPGTYPLVLVAYELVCSKGYQPDVSQAIKAFLKVSVTNGQAKLPDAGYVPLPEAFKAKVTSAVDAIA